MLNVPHIQDGTLHTSAWLRFSHMYFDGLWLNYTCWTLLNHQIRQKLYSSLPKKDVRWSRSAGGRSQQASYSVKLSVPIKSVANDGWSPNSVVVKHSFHCIMFVFGVFNPSKCHILQAIQYVFYFQVLYD